MPEQDNKQKTLGLDPVQANALFAWQHGLIDPDPFYTEDFNLYLAFISVEERAKEVGMTQEELKQYSLDEAWIDEELLREAKWREKKK